MLPREYPINSQSYLNPHHPKGQDDEAMEITYEHAYAAVDVVDVEIDACLKAKQPPSNGEVIKKFPPKCTTLYRAALGGDWQAAEIILQRDPHMAYATITDKGDTALHIAAAAKRTKFVRQLVPKWMRNDLSTQNEFGYTAFWYAASSGEVEIADVMRVENSALVTMRDKNGWAPIYVAAFLGNKDMVSYLYKFTADKDLLSDEWFKVLTASMRSSMYDVALDILKRNAYLATLKGKAGEALHQLVQQDMCDISASKEAILERFVAMFSAIPRLSWLKRTCERPLMRKKARLLAKKLWDDGLKTVDVNVLELFGGHPILHDAAKAGNVGLITMLTCTNPNLMWHQDGNKHTIFHSAVLYRQENVFSLIHQIGSQKRIISVNRDNNRNNILHLAAKLPPPDRLKVVSGPALQIQRELMWFKEVEKLVPSSCLTAENNKGKLPRKLFSEEHEELFKEGEKWMKETSNYCMIVAALIATVAFAAAFTVPGGNSDDTGMPILSTRSWFTIFVVADAVAMFCSTASIILFLSIQTSRYQEEDFLVKLPMKLVLGLTTLFGSIVGMILTFGTAFFLLFHDENTRLLRWIAVPAGGLLVVLFGALHFRLWVDTISSAYWSRFLFRSSKHSLY